jgi:hypothetical protein
MIIIRQKAPQAPQTRQCNVNEQSWHSKLDVCSRYTKLDHSPFAAEDLKLENEMN